jgi:hypothetical protein
MPVGGLSRPAMDRASPPTFRKWRGINDGSSEFFLGAPEPVAAVPRFGFVSFATRRTRHLPPASACPPKLGPSL